jgi:flagellar basal body-associated protein FliL
MQRNKNTLKERRSAGWRWPIALAALSLGGLVLSGCSRSTRSTAGMEANELLEFVQQQQQKDPSAYIEYDLGKFRVSHPLPGGEGQVMVTFQLYGVLPPARQSQLKRLLPRYENRMRDAVISLVQRTQTEHLTDPSLAYFKADLVAAINRVLQDRVLADVAFSEYSIERG